MRIYCIVVIALIMAGCAGVNNYEKFYKPYGDPAKLQDAELLKPGQEPQLVRATNFDSDMKDLRSKQYIAVGVSSFNGRYEDERMIKAQAARVGATIVLVHAASTKGHAAAAQQRYDQVAVFFVKSTQKLKFGVAVMDLTTEQRASLDRNTGAVVDIVMENSPAFNANVLPGDILIEVNGVSVLNAKQAVELMLGADPSQGTASFKVLRNRVEKVITITF
jgi:serine protease Do